MVVASSLRCGSPAGVGSFVPTAGPACLFALAVACAKLAVWPVRSASSAAFVALSGAVPQTSSSGGDASGASAGKFRSPTPQMLPATLSAAGAPPQLAVASACGAAVAAVAVVAAARRRGRTATHAVASSARRGAVHVACQQQALAPAAFAAPAALAAPPPLAAARPQQQQPQRGQRRVHTCALPEAAEAAAAVQAAVAALPKELLELLGPPLPAEAFDGSSISEFFFDPRLQWDENGNVLLDPRGDPLPDNLWTQFVACQATLIKRLDQGIHGLGVPGSFGLAVACYTLGIRTALYPFVKGQLETTAKIQVLAPRVNELREKYKDNEERLNQEVGLLYMDLQIDPLGAVVPLLFQLPVFWGLYRAIRRLAIVNYAPLKEGFLWIPSLYGPNYQPDPSFNWITQWQGPLIELHPKMGWTDFALYSILPLGVCLTYKEVLKEALSDENSPKLLQFLPFLLAFITVELPQAMGIYIATNIVSSVALTAYTKNQISSKIPGYDEFVKTGKWPPGVDPEKVLAKAFGVKRLVNEDGTPLDDPATVPEAVFAGRSDFIPELLSQGRDIDECDDRGIPASMYTLALDNQELLDRLLEMGANPLVQDKKGNSLLHYAAGYGRYDFVPKLLSSETKSMLNHVNEDGQTPLDVARVNLSQDKVADDVRKVISVLNEYNAEGKTTTEADEARFEEAREEMKKQAEVKQARDALKALAMAAQAREAAAAAEKEAEEKAKADAEGAAAQEGEDEGPGLLEQSLDRIKALDVETLKARLGDKMSDEQLERLSARLATMSPEEVAAFAAGLPSMKASEAEELSSKEEHATGASATASAAAAPEPEKQQKQSVLVD